jgi:hypothetical protein
MHSLGSPGIVLKQPERLHSWLQLDTLLHTSPTAVAAGLQEENVK